MNTIKQNVLDDGTVETVVANSITEDVIVRSKVGYVPQFVTDKYGQTSRVTKDVTFLRLLKIIQKEYPEYDLISIGTPVNFDVAPTHLTRVEMNLETEEQVEICLKEIAASDMMIRSRVQPAWAWESPIRNDLSVILHVSWFDTVYFLQFKDIFLGSLHCRYSAKFGFDPKHAKMSHFRYDSEGHLELADKLNKFEEKLLKISDQIDFIRVFRDGSEEKT